MDRKFWNSIGIVLIASNGLAIIALLETIIFGRPYVVIFIIILYLTWSFNKKIFQKKK